MRINTNKMYKQAMKKQHQSFQLWCDQNYVRDDLRDVIFSALINLGAPPYSWKNKQGQAWIKKQIAARCKSEAN